MSNSLSLSKVNSIKGICSSDRKTPILEQLQVALDNLSSMVFDVKELVVFLASYPRLYRQPYSMHLQVSNCMFGRQMESELVIDFLLHTQRHGCEELEVLPIVGPGKVGKSTLVAHVCKNERVRDHFSEILFLRDHDFIDGDLSTFKGCDTRHQNSTSNSNKDGGCLVVVDLVGEFNEDAWNVLYSSCKQCMPSTSKIIIASRSTKITKFGTTQAIILKYLSREAYWYFFKTLTFGSIDPKMHPRFANLAMELAKTWNRCWIAANLTSCLLRDNFDINFRCKVLAFLRGLMQKHVSRFGGHPLEVINQNRPAHL
jgi:GTPase SAR1 family protein